MRLYKHINKRKLSIDPKDNKKLANQIISKHLDKIENKIKIEGYSPSLRKLCMVLSSIYMQDRVRFIDDGDEYLKSKKFIKGSDFYINGDIEIFLKDEAVDNIDNLLNKGKLFTEIVDVLSNTLAHIKKVASMKDMFSFIGYNPIKKYIIDNIDEYIDIVRVEKEEEGFSTTKSMIYDLIGKLPVYDRVKNI